MRIQLFIFRSFKKLMSVFLLQMLKLVVSY